jgi:hypothetical protein
MMICLRQNDSPLRGIIIGKIPPLGGIFSFFFGWSFGDVCGEIDLALAEFKILDAFSYQIDHLSVCGATLVF